MASPLRSTFGALSSLTSSLPKVAGQSISAAASAAPQLVSNVGEALSTLPASAEAASRGKFGSIKPGPGLKAAFELAHVPVNPDGIGQFVSTAAQSSLGYSAQSNLDSVNEIFSALGLPVWIVRGSNPDTQAVVRVQQTNQANADDSEPKQTGLTPRQFMQFMHEARRSGNLGGGLEKYVEDMIEDGHLTHLTIVPNSFETKLYVDVARLMIFIWHHSFQTLNSASFWGHQLQVVTSPHSHTTSGSKGRKARTHVGEEQISLIVDKMLESEAVNLTIVPDFIEKRLYVNCIMVVFQLLDDLVTGDGDEVTCMGHALRFSLEKQPLDLLQRTLKDRPVRHCQIDDAVLNELTDELLADEDVNLQWMPDVIERQIYKSVLRLMIRVMEEVVCRVKMKMLGRDIDVRILGVEDVKADQASKAQKPEAKMYKAEEDPLKIISSTELEERLKDIDEQRRILEAIKEMGGVEFDMTAERPMIQRKFDHAPSTEEARRVSGDEQAAGEEEEAHEFQRLAHTLKLGRSLSVKCEVEADIDIPHSMIADLETYPNWMPWCTAGKVVGQKRDEVTDDGRECIYNGEVGFGFETGSFLGTLGDTVKYRITSSTPGDNDNSVSPKARVMADAVDGFAYGEKLVYDWRFKQLRPGLTKVELDMLFQARSVLYMPFWDSMQNMVISKMLVAFKARAEVLQKQNHSKNE